MGSLRRVEHNIYEAREGKLWAMRVVNGVRHKLLFDTVQAARSWLMELARENKGGIVEPSIRINKYGLFDVHCFKYGGRNVKVMAYCVRDLESARAVRQAMRDSLQD